MTHVAHAGRPAMHFVLVSPPKSGSHLFLRLANLLGFANLGIIMTPPTVKKRPAEATVAGLFARLGRRMPFAPVSPFSAWHYARAALGPIDVTLHRHLRERTCLNLHELDCSNAPFLTEWGRTRYPPLVFGYRDPRDQLLSFVDYLSPGGRWSIGFAPIPSQVAHADILASLPNRNDRIMHAIQDETFPFKNVMAQSTWLLRHPLVCSVRYEDLVGEEGGGARALQERAVAEVMNHLGASGDTKEIARQLYDRGSRTFAHGTIGRWRSVFTREHIEAFERRFGAVLYAYGYREGSSA